MRITADTNLLLRAVVEDDEQQARVAQAVLRRATVVAVPVPALCELAWVLRRTYSLGVDEIVATIEEILVTEAVSTDWLAVEAGLKELRAGGDFADGVIAHQGETLGGAVFASFDRGAVARLRERGVAAADPSELAE